MFLKKPLIKKIICFSDVRKDFGAKYSNWDHTEIVGRTEKFPSLETYSNIAAIYYALLCNFIDKQVSVF